MNVTALEEYIETGNVQYLELLLSKNPTLINQLTSHDMTPLLLACYYKKNQIIQTLLKYTSTLSIFEACALGFKEHVEAIISNNKDLINSYSLHGFTPLGIASHFEKKDIVHLLLLNHADPNFSSQNGFNVYPLHAALNMNNNEICKILVEAGANVNTVQQGNVSPLHIASQNGNIDLLILLLENGAKVEVLTSNGQSASDLAFSKGHIEIAKILKIN